MALRLTQAPAPAPAPAPAAGAPARITSPSNDSARVQALLDAGAARLAAGDRAAYVRLFAQARELPGAHTPYYAAKLLLEQGLAASATVEGAQLIDLLVTLAHAVLELLGDNPAEPVLLNYAGVIFYELWALEGARALFLAARRLDPELPNLESNIAGVKQRRRDAGVRLPRLHADLPRLNRRAVALAGRARPATDLRLSLCMIVKDEEAMLGRTLAAAAPGVDEIVIVDTGSSDRTVEIAHEYGALVIEHEWTGDFSAARNVSLEAATGDWILYLDADEVLVADDIATLRKLRGHTWREAFFFHETNFTGREDDGVAVVHSAMRMLRNRPEYRFRGRLHEQIAHNLPGFLPERITESPVRILHYGYLGVVRDAKDKSRRNLELLQAQIAERTPTPFDHYNLGSEYVAVGDVMRGIEHFEQAWELIGSQTQHDFLPALISRMLRALRAAGRCEELLVRAEQGLERFPAFTDLVYEMALAKLKLGDEAGAVELFERCIEMGDAPSRYTALVGAGTYLPRLGLAEWHLARDRPAAALEQLRHCGAHHPEFFGIYQAYANALLRCGVSPADTVAEITAARGSLSPTVRFMLGTALLAHGAGAEAVEQFSVVAERQPDNAPVLELLLESLLVAQDFDRFEAALAGFEALELAPRERRERLARMYLRRGFLRSAGREWLAVCEQRPDARALRGLAEVAARNGQQQEAAAFAAEALKFSGALHDNPTKC